MTSLKRLSISVALTLVLATCTLAGETSAPPCSPPDPGETSAPPCAGAQSLPADPTPPVQTLTAESVYSITEVAMDLLQSVLPIF
jgi:hypothetical protein